MLFAMLLPLQNFLEIGRTDANPPFLIKKELIGCAVIVINLHVNVHC